MARAANLLMQRANSRGTHGRPTCRERRATDSASDVAPPGAGGNVATRGGGAGAGAVLDGHYSVVALLPGRIPQLVVGRVQGRYRFDSGVGRARLGTLRPTRANL